jgi:maltose alpha-D-glucosyltransferase / alpha-amylase
VRRAVDARFPGRVLIAEANQWPADVVHYFGSRSDDGKPITNDECHMCFHFPLMPRMFMAVRREERHPITEILAQTPAIPDGAQWGLFLRNHDELTLEMVTDAERDFLYAEYAKDPRMRRNVGIARRLAPLLDNDRRIRELFHSLLFSLPGTPFLYYGDEIGMGDNIHLGDRDGVRTPMQWTPDRNAGFSTADTNSLHLPLIQDPVFGYQAVNVEGQRRDPSSFLHWIRRLIAVRRQHPVFGDGDLVVVPADNHAVLAYVRTRGSKSVLCVSNLSGRAQAAGLPLDTWAGHTPIELLGGIPFPAVGESPYVVMLPAYGFFWFELIPPAV